MKRPMRNKTARASSPARARKTRAEVQQELNRREEAEASRAAADLKTESASQMREAEIRRAVEGVTIEAVVQTASGLDL